MSNVALLVRVSTQEQAREGYSIGEQTERLKKYAEAMGWDIYNVYTDAGFSGASLDRPALRHMIRDIEKGLIDKVVVYKLDRLSRSQKDTLFLIEDVFLAHGCDFVSMSENFDTSTSFGRAMIGILAVFAQLEREQIRDRMLMGKEARAKEGLFPSGKSPIGYDYVDGRLVVNEYEKIQIERVFSEYAQGKSFYAIAKGLNESGMMHKYGEWKPDTIRAILSRRTYTGLIKHNETYFKGQHEPIITEEKFDQVQKQLIRRREESSRHHRRAGKASSFLGGFLVCSHCGAKYAKYTQLSKKNGRAYYYQYYKCNSRSRKTPNLIKDPDCKNKTWRMEALDNLIFDEIRKLATDPDYMENIHDEMETDSGADIIQREISKIDDQMSRLMDLYALEEMPVDILQDRILALNDRKQNLEAELDALSAKQDRLTQKETLHLAESFGDILDVGDFDEIRTVISTLIDYIEIDGEDIIIHWSFA